MATRIATPPYPTYVELPSLRRLRSRFLVVGFVACLQKTAFSFGHRLYSQLHFSHVIQPSLVNDSKRVSWSIRSNVDNPGSDPTSSNNGGTRLVRAIQAIQRKLITRARELRKNLPTKLLFFLIGFYCATAFATVIGQTGDWDILSAALAVVVVEGIGALMYRTSLPLFDKVKHFITMFNYWKAGLSLGLFLDSFKYEMDSFIAIFNPSNFEIDCFPFFL